MWDVACVVEGDWSGTSRRSGIGGNGREFTNIVMKAPHN